MDQKPIVFISHIHEEKELAINLKCLIETHFLAAVEVFVSSDEGSNGVGQQWLNNITNALRSCVIEIILCSCKSLARPWINFEAGAGWIREIVVVPACHSGINHSDLPIPLNLLNAINLNSASGLNNLFGSIANAIKLNSPKVDFTEFINQVKNFEEDYLLGEDFRTALNSLDYIEGFVDWFKSENSSTTSDVWLTETESMNILQSMNFMTKHKLLKFSKLPASRPRIDNDRGIVHAYRFEKLTKPSSIVNLFKTCYK